MKTTVTRTLLKHIGNMIDHGQPIWAMLWAQEYKEELGELHPALQSKAHKKIMQLIEAQSMPTRAMALFQEALQGTLSGREKLSIRNRVKEIELSTMPLQRKIISFGSSRARYIDNTRIRIGAISRRS